MNKRVAALCQWLLQSCAVTNSTTRHKSDQTAVLLSRLSVVLIHVNSTRVLKVVDYMKVRIWAIYSRLFFFLFLTHCLVGKFIHQSVLRLNFQSPMVTVCTYTLNTTKLYVQPTQLYLCVLCGSENKQRLFLYTALTDWFV